MTQGAAAYGVGPTRPARKSILIRNGIAGRKKEERRKKKGERGKKKEE